MSARFATIRRLLSWSSDAIGQRNVPFIWTGLVLAVGLLTGTGHAATSTYRVTFDSWWSASTHPVDFPANAHYSTLVGGTHNSNASFWSPGGMATEGIRRMAEQGNTSVLLSEVDTAVAAGTARRGVLGKPLATTPNNVQITVELDDEFPLLTLVTMVAPSPDWFVGVHGLPLYDQGQWVSKQVVELLPYDAGTDSGVTFTSFDSPTQPREPIHVLSTGTPFQGTGPLGTFTFLRLVDGDLNESGNLDASDMDELSRAIRDGRTESRWDINRDQSVNGLDRSYWIQTLRGSTFGDSNLDGRFNTDDLLTVFQAGAYQDGIAGNAGWMQGDWDGNGDFESADLLLAFQTGGYDAGTPSAIAAVPEPSTLTIVTMLIGLSRFARRRQLV